MRLDRAVAQGERTSIKTEKYKAAILEKSID
jgi:hypothetical protein